MLQSASWIEEKTKITFVFVLLLFVPNMTVIVKQMLLQMTFQQKVTVSGAMHLILHTSSYLDYHCGNEVDSVQFRDPCKIVFGV